MNTLVRTFLIAFSLLGMASGQYWQQAVEYDMGVHLDTTKRTLNVHSDLTYINHSPDNLDKILMQLYHNAFNDGTIAQSVWARYGDDLDLSKGWTGISIQNLGQGSSQFEYEIRDDTILDIVLPTELSPGDTLHFSIDWTLTIHPHIDRSGYRGDQYDFSQWYPKFVVYDENGWHDDPFGDWGEFYGEFGNFSVTLDLPGSFIVGATGLVSDGDPGWKAVTVDTSQAWDEWFSAFHIENLANRKSLSDSTRRIVTFKADHVHDFAWVTSPDFVYEHGSWNGIDVHVLFTPEVGKKWTKKVAGHGAGALAWLSEKFGFYPWPQMTITKGLLGGGMEYPMLIMDDSESESLIVHEIGHNWYYGILGNDELDDAWLDEGFTTFQTLWYLEAKYPDNGYSLSRKRLTPFEHDKLPRQMFAEDDYKSLLGYMRSPANEPMATHSFDFVNYRSYSYNAYDKASYMLYVLKNYLGEERFLAGMRLYFDRWAFKHVTEERFINAMEDGSGEDLDWYFDQWLNTSNYIDYKLGPVSTEKLATGDYKTRINVENLGGLFVPISARLYSASNETVTVPLKEFKHRQLTTIEALTFFEPQRIYLDPDNTWLDADRRNNDSKRKRAFRYNYKGWDHYPDDRNLYLWKPQFGYNDEAGLGLGIRLDRVYRNTGEFVALTLDYNTGSQEIDASVSFRQKQTGMPYEALVSGSAVQWRETTFADFGYEMNWSRSGYSRPLHWLTILADYSEASVGTAGFDPAQNHTRLGMKYEFQNKGRRGTHGFSAQVFHSLAALSADSREFMQVNLMNSWIQALKKISINNRSNILLNSKDTPVLLMNRLASKDLRSTYLDRLGSSLRGIESLEGLGSAYYQAGGGRLRGYSDSLDVPVNYLWSNNLEVNFPDRTLRGQRIGIYWFFDLGQSSQDSENWQWLSDFGFGLTLKSDWKRTNWLTTYIRPMQIKIEVPLSRYVDGEFSSASSNNLWLFTISN